MSSAALALVGDQRPHTALIHPVLDAAGVMKVHDAIAELVQKTLHEGKDYGTIPGTKTPTLYKSGAERLCVGFGLVDLYEIIEKEVDHTFENVWEKRGRDGAVYKSGTAYGLYSYTVKCTLRRREDNAFVSEGVGYCSSLETKYMDRPRDTANTILKIAKKRAKVDATLSGLGLSDRFTQDLEDGERPMEDEHGNATQRPPGKEVKAAEPRNSKPAAEKLFPFKGEWKGKPLGSMPMSAIEGFCRWIREKQTEKNDKSWNGDLLDALVEVLAAKQDEAEKDQGKLALDAKAPATPPPAGEDAPPSKKEDASSASSAAAEKPRELPANRARWNAAQLQARALELLKHPKLPKSMLDAAVLAQLNEGKLNHGELVKQVTTLEKWLDDAEAFDEANDANDHDDLPF